jgi:histidinol phosphatase-like enzyme
LKSQRAPNFGKDNTNQRGRLTKLISELLNKNNKNQINNMVIGDEISRLRLATLGTKKPPKVRVTTWRKQQASRGAKAIHPKK